MTQPTLEDLLTAAQTIQMEAGQESRQGKYAVAFVILNRWKRPGYFKQETIWGVCHAPLQFSCWNNSPDRNLETVMALPYSDRSILSCLSIMIDAFLGSASDPTRGADHYYADYIIAPKWANPARKTAHIGRHLFYKLAEDVS